MKTELRNKILEWKTEQNVVGTREIYKMKISLIENEYLFKMKQAVKVSYADKYKIVTAEKYFQTQSQNNNMLNANGDLIKFERVKLNLENDFENKYQTAVDELLVDNTEEPFE